MSWTITPLLTNAKGTKSWGPGVRLEPTGFETRVGGAGGWESLARPRRAPAIAWVGGTVETLTLPALITGINAAGHGVDVPIDATCARLEAMAKVDRYAGEPPRVVVAGVTGVATSTRWVITDLQWGEYIPDSAGRRLQQDVTVVLELALEPALVKGPAKKARIRKASKPKKQKGKKK